MTAIEGMTAALRAEVLAEAEMRNDGFYGAELWRLRERISQLDAAQVELDADPAEGAPSRDARRRGRPRPGPPLPAGPARAGQFHLRWPTCSPRPKGPMNQLTNVLLAVAISAFGVVSLIEDLPILRNLATFFTLGGLIGGAVVYRAERRGRELSALQVRQILFRWALGVGAAGGLGSALAELL